MRIILILLLFIIGCTTNQPNFIGKWQIHDGSHFPYILEIKKNYIANSIEKGKVTSTSNWKKLSNASFEMVQKLPFSLSGNNEISIYSYGKVNGNELTLNFAKGHSQKFKLVKTNLTNP